MATAFQADAFQNDAFQVAGVTVAGVGPSGAATFVLDMQDGAKVTYSWLTSVTKSYSGKETRESDRAAPRQRYSGAAYLLDGDDRTVRSAMVSAAASGQPFLLGLPFEELTIAADSTGTSIAVNPAALALSDWAANPGQRVVVVGGGLVTPAVVQSGAGATISIDVAAGASGLAGGRIMPAMAVFLDPGQGFGAYAVNADLWSINAHAALFGFANVDAMGVGVSLTTFDGLVVADRCAQIDGQAAESMQSGAEIIDLGNVIAAAGAAPVADWGRKIRIRSSAVADFQWIKALAYAARGAQVPFLLPSWRPDLVYVSTPGAGTLKVQSAGTPGGGNYLTWFALSPAHRRLQVLRADGTTQLVVVSGAGDNLDGTLTLNVSPAVTGAVVRISFLEQVRFESDDLDVTWSGGTFLVDAAARVVQQ